MFSFHKKKHFMKSQITPNLKTANAWKINNTILKVSFLQSDALKTAQFSGVSLDHYNGHDEDCEVC